jgi:hypothetical protein
MDSALPAFAAPTATDALRADRLFAATYAVIARRCATYLALVLAFGVAPTAIACALFDLTPAQLGLAAPGVRIVSMLLFVLGDAALGGALARLALEDRPTLVRTLRFSPRSWLALLGVAACLDIPMLGLNLVSGLITHDPTVGLALYGLRFAVGVALGALWCGAAAVVVMEGRSAPAALARALALTRGRRGDLALFTAAFFILKVLGPYLLIDLGLQALSPWLPGAVLAWGGVLIWNLLACTLGVATALAFERLCHISES